MKKFSIVLLAFLIALSPVARAATVEWNNTGTAWNTGSDWVGGAPPADSTVTDIAAFGGLGVAVMNPVLSNARSVNGVTFLTNAYNYTISGSTLTVGSGGITSGAIFATETFSNTIKTSQSQQWTIGGHININGTLDLNSTSTAARTLTLNGAGQAFFNGVVQNSFAGSTGNLTYSGDPNGSLTLANANTYSGLTTITSGSLFGMHDMAFGSSNVSLTGNTAMLTLSSGLLNDYIANTSTLSITNGGTVALNFAGTDVVGAFSVNGTSFGPGVYNSVNQPGVLTGIGSITVVPEPATFATVLLGTGLLLGFQRLFRRLA